MRSKQRGHIGARGPGSDEEWDWIDWVMCFVCVAIAAGGLWLGYWLRH